MNISNNFELNYLITALSPAEPASFQTLKDLKDHIKTQSQSPFFKTLHANIQILVNDLIFKQFAYADKEAIRELTSNAMDAQIRAKREGAPIELTIENETFKIKDSGDGIHAGGLINLFVPGRSSNPNAIFNLENGIPKVTGRFGQGALAAFFFLLYESVSHPSSAPTFQITNGTVAISFVYLHQEKNYQVTFNAKSNHDGKIEVNKLIVPITNLDPAPKSMRLRTCREGFTALQIDFCEINNQVWVDIKETKKKKMGTSIKIISPLIKEKCTAIVNYVKETFSFVQNTPFFINNERVNPSGAFEIIPFDGGELYFQPGKKTKNGHLIICEEGKRILQFPTSHANLFEKVGVSFHRLTLSQERGTLDYPSLEKSVAHLVKTILTSNNDIEFKTALLNALVPLLEEGVYTKIIETIKEEIVTLSQKDVSQSIALAHPLYIDLTHVSYVKTDHNWRLFINPHQTVPVLAFEKGNFWYIILSKKLFHPSRNDLSLLNQILINLWIQLKYSGVKDFSFQTPSSASSKPLLSTPLDSTSRDFNNYGMMPDADMPFLSTECKIRYPEDQSLFEKHPDMNTWIKDLEKNHIKLAPRKFFHLIHDFLVKMSPKFDYIPDFSYLFREILFNPNLTLSILDSILKNTYLMAEKMNAVDYYIFLVGLSRSKELIHSAIDKEPFNYHSFLDYYSEVKMILEELHIKDKYDCCNFFLKISPETLDSYKYLLNSINDKEVRKKLSALVLNVFTDIGALAKLPQKELFDLINCFTIENDRFVPERKEVPFVLTIASPLDEDDYSILSDHLFSKSYSFEYKKALFWSYYYAGHLLEILKIDNENSYSFTLEEIFTNFIALTMSWKNEREILEKSSFVEQTFKDIFYAHRGGNDFKPSLCDLNPIVSLMDENYHSSVKRNDIRQLERDEFSKLSKAWKQNKTDPESFALKNFYLGIWEKYELISDEARPFIYVLLFGNQVQTKTQDFTFIDPTDKEPSTPLHDDPFVIQQIGSKQLARIRIQGAIKQSLEPYYCLGELVKNGKEAAQPGIHPIIKFEVHSDGKGHLFLIVKDNGHGMDQDGLNGLKCPGFSTKRKEVNQINPNFGIGFDSVFADFDEVFVQSSKDNVLSFVSFKKENENLMTRTAPSQRIEGPSWTTIILKRKQSDNLLLEIIRLRSALVAKCRHMEDVTITFNDMPVNSIHHSPLVSHQYLYNGQFVDVQIKNVEGGLYCNGIKMGRMDDTYTSVLPSSLKTLLEKEKLFFTILFPPVEQLRNRGRLVENKALLVATQKGVLMTALKYCNFHLIDGKTLPGLSDDFWFDFLRPNFSLNQNLKELLALIKADFNCSDKEAELKNAIINEIKKFFTDTKPPVFLPRQNCDPNRFLNLLEEQLESSDWSTNIKPHLENPLNLALLTIHFPIGHGNSLFSLRNEIQKTLRTHKILEDDGSYNFDYILEQSKDDLNRILDDAFFEIENNFKSAIPLTKILQGFISKITAHLNSMQIQHTLPAIVDDKCIVMKQFLSQVAFHYFQKEISVEFYSSADGILAKIISGTTKMMVNTQNKEYGSFLKMIEAKSLDEIMASHFLTLKEWINTLIHELTHMDEAIDLPCTHNQEFKDKMADKINPLLVFDFNQTSVLDILMKSCGKGLKRKFEDNNNMDD